MLEKEVEKHFVKKVREAGGLALKFESPTMNGVPDRIVLYGGCAYFVELKAPGEKPRPLQVRCHEKFARYGVPVYVIDNKKDAERFCVDMQVGGRNGCMV